MPLALRLREDYSAEMSFGHCPAVEDEVDPSRRVLSLAAGEMEWAEARRRRSAAWTLDAA